MGTELGLPGDSQPSWWGLGEVRKLPLLGPSVPWWSAWTAVGDDLEWTISGRLPVSCLHWFDEASLGGGGGGGGGMMGRERGGERGGGREGGRRGTCKRERSREKSNKRK